MNLPWVEIDGLWLQNWCYFLDMGTPLFNALGVCDDDEIMKCVYKLHHPDGNPCLLESTLMIRSYLDKHTYELNG